MSCYEIIKIIRDNDAQALILYDLLRKRSHSISHKQMPSQQEHREFILSHTYRAWYLIKDVSSYIGSVYINKNNIIGINVIDGFEDCISQVISLVTARHKPLAPRPSIRQAAFCINVPPTNLRMIEELEKLGATLIQKTYSLK